MVVYINLQLDDIWPIIKKINTPHSPECLQADVLENSIKRELWILYTVVAC